MKTSEKLRRWHNLEIISYCYLILHITIYIFIKVINARRNYEGLDLFTFLGLFFSTTIPLVVCAFLIWRITKYWIPKK